MKNELRSDYFLDRQVIISVGRGKRPHDYLTMADSASSQKAQTCYFCPGNEHLTPAETSREEEGGKWALRVFPNMFPAATQEEGEASAQLMSAYGYHEVIVESPDHDKTVADLPVERIAQVLRVYSERVEAMLADPRVKYALVFKNHGRVAGASLAHTHSQIISVPVVPKLIRDEVEGAERYALRRGSCPLCDAWKEESTGLRAIWEDENVCAFAPYASRSPMEAWVMTKRHIQELKDLTSEEALSFAKALKLVLSRLKGGLNDASYNLYFHASPRGADLHLHAEILPKLSILAGFELGSDIVINTMPPETAAEFYRQQ